jgi:uncharacterized protein YqeY
MSLKQTIRTDLNESVKQREELKSSVLRLLLAALSNKETEKRTRAWKEKPKSSSVELEKISQLTDDEVMAVIATEIKKRKESIELFERGGKNDLAEKEGNEAKLLQAYLPEQLSEDEVRKIVKSAVAKTGAKTQKEMGLVIKEVMNQAKGKVDGGTVSKIAKEFLS